jgi:site-specific DNA-cytosine methylase
MDEIIVNNNYINEQKYFASRKRGRIAVVSLSNEPLKHKINKSNCDESFMQMQTESNARKKKFEQQANNGKFKSQNEDMLIANYESKYKDLLSRIKKLEENAVNGPIVPITKIDTNGKHTKNALKFNLSKIVQFYELMTGLSIKSFDENNNSFSCTIKNCNKKLASKFDINIYANKNFQETVQFIPSVNVNNFPDFMRFNDIFCDANTAPVLLATILKFLHKNDIDDA